MVLIQFAESVVLLYCSITIHTDDTLRRNVRLSCVCGSYYSEETLR